MLVLNITLRRYEQKLEESKRQLVVSEAKLVELKKNVESVREKVCRLHHLLSQLLSQYKRSKPKLGSQISQQRA